MIEGSLRNVPLTDVFQVIATAKKSGVLSLTRGRSRARINLSAGRIDFASLTPEVDLAELLLRTEILSVTELTTLMRDAAPESDGLRLALAARSRGLLDSAGLNMVLERQVLEVLGELLLWRSGNFSFSGEPEQATGRVSGGFDPMMLLMQIIGEEDPGSEGAIDEARVFRQAGDPSKTELPPSAWEVLAAVDGRRTAASIAADIDLPERHTYRLLHMLERLKVIEVSPFDVEIPEVVVVTPWPAAQRVLRLLLLRYRAWPRIEGEMSAALEYLEKNHPRAIIVDDRQGGAWNFVREARQLPGRSYLPAVVIAGPHAEGGVLARLGRRRALTLTLPFEEVAFQRLVTRMVGTPAT